MNQSLDLPDRPSQGTPSVGSPPPAAWRRGLATLGCVVLGAVLLVAGWAKSLDPSSLANQVTQEGLDFLLPATVVAFIALFLEWFLGAVLLMGTRHRVIFWPTAALVAFFVFLTGRKYLRFLNGEEMEGESCGCFGNLVERTPAEAFWQDFLFMVPALVLMALAIDKGPKLPWKRILAALSIGVLMTGFAWKAPDLPLDNLATRLKPGVDPFGLCAGSEEDGTRVCLDAILPEVASGDHIVVMADVTDEIFLEAIAKLNEVAWQKDMPKLWILSSATEDELFELRFGHGPTFDIRETPGPLMKPLYRTLPRSFRVQNGEVTQTYSGLPPWQELQTP